MLDLKEFDHKKSRRLPAFSHKLQLLIGWVLTPYQSHE
jgi:hypothetical protein